VLTHFAEACSNSSHQEHEACADHCGIFFRYSLPLLFTLNSHFSSRDHREVYVSATSRSAPRLALLLLVRDATFCPQLFGSSGVPLLIVYFLPRFHLVSRFILSGTRSFLVRSARQVFLTIPDSYYLGVRFSFCLFCYFFLPFFPSGRL